MVATVRKADQRNPKDLDLDLDKIQRHLRDGREAIKIIHHHYSMLERRRSSLLDPSNITFISEGKQKMTTPLLHINIASKPLEGSKITPERIHVESFASVETTNQEKIWRNKLFCKAPKIIQVNSLDAIFQRELWSQTCRHRSYGSHEENSAKTKTLTLEERRLARSRRYTKILIY